jgi:hypothetical protein
MGDAPLDGASQIMRIGDAPLDGTSQIASCICSRLRQDPPWGLEVRTSCPNLQSDTLVVQLGGSGESGAGGCAAGWICHGGRWRSRGERVAAGGWSTIEPLLAIVCRGGSGKVPPT